MSTPSQTVGPFFSIGMCRRETNELVPDGVVRIGGRVLDGAGEVVPDALVEVWQADPIGEYGSGWGRCGTDDDGGYRFVTVKPGAADGQAPHLTLLVFARGLLKPVLTRMYFPDEAEANSGDAVLATVPADERELLVAVPDGELLRFDIRLQGDDQTPFFDL